MHKLEDLRAEYTSLWQAADPIPSKLHEIDNIIDRIVAAHPRYEVVERMSHVPWVLIAALHNMECSLRFDRHLHNGDPMQTLGHWSRTRNVPAGRPLKPGPWTWEESALDALTCDGLFGWTDWSVAGCLYRAESFNGWGYRGKGIHSPYLWGGSSEQQRGKYVRDHVWSSTAMTDQIGVATILMRMEDRDIYVFPEDEIDDDTVKEGDPF